MILPDHPTDNARPIDQQIPVDIDLIHFHTTWEHMDRINQPYVVTMHGNGDDDTMVPLNINTIFVSQNHAQRFGSTSFVYNGLDWNDYSPCLPKRQKRIFSYFWAMQPGNKKMYRCHRSHSTHKV